MLQITALMDNKPSENHALINKHGLSFLIEEDGFRMLFDCGPDSATLVNARHLGKDLSDLDAVILSHSHYDHSGGYPDLISMGLGSCVLYTGPCFFEPKYARKGICYSNLSAGFDDNFLARYAIEHRVCESMTKIASNMWLFADFPRTHTFETIPERFVRFHTVDTPKGLNAAMQPDDFADEICLVADTSKGLIVLVGCSHPGILNMVEHVKDMLGRPVYGVFGGTHLVEADTERVNATIDILKDMGLHIIGLSHCSGEEAEKTINERQDVESCHLAVGDTLFFD